MTSLRWFAALQLLIAAGLMTVLWVLHTRLGSRPFFRWWAWAWGAFAAYLVLGALLLPLSSDWGPLRTAFVLLATMCGYLQPALLVFGAMSLRSADLPTRRLLALGVSAVLILAALSVGASTLYTNAVDSFCMRVAPRAVMVAGAAVFCIVALGRCRREIGPAAFAMTGVSCLLQGMVQATYGLATIGRLVAGEAGPLATMFDDGAMLRSLVFLVDIVSAYGVCLGMVLLLVEDFRLSARALEESILVQRRALDANAALQAEISERRRVESALRLSEAKFAAAFRATPCGIAISTFEDGRVLEINDAAEMQTGYRRGEIIGRPTQDLLWVDPAERAAIVAEMREHGKVANRQVRWRSKAGEDLTILFSADTIRMDGQSFMLSVALDITAHKQVEARHHAILRAIPDWMFLMSNDGVFLDCHVRDTRFLLVPPEVFIGRKVGEVLPPGLADELTSLYARAARGDETATLEYRMTFGDETRHYESRAVRCDHEKVLCIVRDVTDARRHEDEARRLRQDLAHIGRVTTLSALTGSLAHEIRQPLAAIRTNAQAAQRLLPPNPALNELRLALTEIVGDSQRAVNVIERVAGMLKRDRPAYSEVDLNASIEEVVTLLRGDLLARQVRLIVDLDTDLPHVVGDRIQLQQVALNLLMNACDAVESRPEGERQVMIRTTSEDSRVIVSVNDLGVGLTAEQRERVFEPFYTTKPHGMGLGLAICEMIVSVHDGTLTVDTSHGRGTTFSFGLPQWRGTAAPAAQLRTADC